jgi:hypothetical protein
VQVTDLLMLDGERGERTVRVGGGAGRRDGQGERQPCAAGDDFPDRVGLGGDPSAADALGDQIMCLPGGQQIQP